MPGSTSHADRLDRAESLADKAADWAEEADTLARMRALCRDLGETTDVSARDVAEAVRISGVLGRASLAETSVAMLRAATGEGDTA